MYQYTFKSLSPISYRIQTLINKSAYYLLPPGMEKEYYVDLVRLRKMEHLTTHLHRPRTTRSPLSFWGDGGIVPFEPFFHAFPGGLEKIAINRILLILPSRKEEREKFFFLSTGTRRLDLAIRRIECLADK